MTSLAARDVRRVADMCAVYRLFDADDRLLYVGISSRAARRFDEHSVKRWFPLVVKITLEWHDTEAAAHVAERRAIATERPRYNIVGRKPLPRPQPEPPKLLRDMLEVMSDEPWIWSCEAARRLALSSPEYADWDAMKLGRALRLHGVRTKQIFRNGLNRQGVTRLDLRAARTNTRLVRSHHPR